jgi:hypothetical protein
LLLQVAAVVEVVMVLVAVLVVFRLLQVNL